MLYFLIDNSTPPVVQMHYEEKDGFKKPPAQDGMRWVSSDDLPADAVMVQSSTPDIDYSPQEFSNGIETSSVIFPHSTAHDWELVVIDGTPTIIQISASPRKDKAERDALKVAKKSKVDEIKRDIPALLASDKQKDTAEALRLIAELLNLI